MVLGMAVSAVSAQLLKIDYEGWYDYIDEQTGKPYTTPGSVPVPFAAQAVVDLRSPMDLVRFAEYTEFTLRDWRQEPAKDLIRWRAFNEESVLPMNTIRVWDSGRFDIAYYDRMPHLNLSLFLRDPLDPYQIPVPPFEFRG